jgi:hypothetical protein
MAVRFLRHALKTVPVPFRSLIHTTITLYLPVAVLPFPGYKTRLEAAVTDLMAVSLKIRFKLWRRISPAVVIKFVNDTKRLRELKARNKEASLMKDLYISFSVQIADDLSVTTSSHPFFVNMSSIAKERNAKTLLAGTFCDLVYTLVMLEQIVEPASVNASEGQLYIDDVFIELKPPFMHGLGLTVDNNFEPAGNRDISLLKAWRWADRLPGFAKGMPSTPVGIALAAFSWLTDEASDTQTYSNPIWAVLGLEALYCQGSGSVRSQLIVNAQRFVGSTLSREDLDALYNYRSRFLHGQISFPRRFNSYDGTKAFEMFIKRNINSYQNATCLLISSLRLLIQRNLLQLIFSA